MHHREKFLTTNTARIATLLLPECKIHLRGLVRQTLNKEEVLLKGYSPLFLFPSTEASELNEEFLKTLSRPIQLLVPDGSWRQAAKTQKRELAFQGIPTVKIPTGPASTYLLRREPKAGGLATLEAIARALKVIEGPQVSEIIEEIFAAMVSRTMASRAGLFSTSST